MSYWGAREPDESEPSVSVKDGIAAARAGGQILELVLLDRLWTDHAERNLPQNRVDLGSVVERMDSLLDDLSQQIEGVLGQIQELGDDELERRLSQPGLANQRAIDQLRERARKEGGLTAMLRKGIEDAADPLARERTELRTAFERLSDGRKSDGDMSHLTHCGLGLIEAGIGLTYGGPGIALIIDGAERVIEHCAQPG